MLPAPLRPLTCLLVAVLAAGATAQGAQVQPKPVPALPLVELPALPKLTPLSPRNTMLYADRFEVTPSPSDMALAAAPSTGVLISASVPATVTGTTKPEPIQYLVPAGYDPGAPVPLLVAWHGFGTSAASVSAQTTLDEECNARGWAYLAITGIDDKLFGTPLSQQNVAAAIGWLQEQVAIDADRIYGVGFSMGAGCTASFAARHRDPDGLMFAGLGLVSGSYDWTQIWWLESGMRTWLEHPWNFAATPAVAPFAYRRVSDLVFEPGSYPPLPGALVTAQTMAHNLHATPTWMTWDTGDSIPYLPKQSGALAALLASLGGTVQTTTVSGTTDPGTGQPATHSWAVLNEHALCDFLAPLRAVRRPANVRALVDEPRNVSWMRLAPVAAGSFAAAQGEAGPGGNAFTVHDVQGASRVLAAPLVVAPWQLTGTAGAQGFALGVRNVAPAAGWAQNGQGAVTAQFEFEPLGDGLLLPIAPSQSIAMTVKAHDWEGGLTMLPDPAPPGANVTLDVDATQGASLAWLVAGVQMGHVGFGAGHVLLVLPVAPCILMPLVLDTEGDVALQAALPNDASLSGAYLVLQAAVKGPGSTLTGTTNPFRFDIQ